MDKIGDFDTHQANLGMGNFESQQELEKLANQTLQDADLEVIRSSLTILQEMQEVAEYIEDMQSEISVEIT